MHMECAADTVRFAAALRRLKDIAARGARMNAAPSPESFEFAYVAPPFTGGILLCLFLRRLCSGNLQVAILPFV